MLCGEGAGGGVGGGCGSGDGGGVGDGEGAGCVAASFVVLASVEGPAGVAAGPLPQPDTSPQSTTDSAATDRMRLRLVCNATHRATAMPAKNAGIVRPSRLSGRSAMTTFDVSPQIGVA